MKTLQVRYHSTRQKFPTICQKQSHQGEFTIREKINNKYPGKCLRTQKKFLDLTATDYYTQQFNHICKSFSIISG